MYTRTKEILISGPTIEPVSVEEAAKQCRALDHNDDEYLAGLITTAREYLEQVCWSAFITQTWQYWWDRYWWKMFLPRPPLRTYSTTLAAAVTSSTQTSISIAAAGMLTNLTTPFSVTVAGETMLVTTISGTTLTVTRGTGAMTYALGTAVTFNGVSWIKYVPPTGQPIADPQSYLTLDGSIYEVSAQNQLPFLRLQYLRTWPITRGYRDDVTAQVVVGYGSDPGDVPMPIRQAIKLLVAHMYLVRGDEPPQEMPPAINHLIQNYRFKEQ